MNLIGSSNNTTLIDPDQICIKGTLYEYSGSYISVKTDDDIKLEPNKGYWIKCNKSGIVTLNFE